MDKIQENKLLLYKNREKIVRDFEEQEAKTNEVTRSILESNSTSIGPANDLLRYLYIVEQQYQSDNDETRTKTIEIFNDYLAQFRQSDEVIEEEEEEEEENNQQSNEPQSTPITTFNPQPTTIRSQSLVVVPSQTQPPNVLSTPPQPPTVGPSPTQPPKVGPSPTQPPKVGPSPTQPPTGGPSLAQPVPAGPLLTRKPDHITPATLAKYEKLLLEAQQFEKRYTTVSVPRKKQLAAPLKDMVNKLREETFKSLTSDILNFLTGQEYQVAGQSIRISNNEERLLCLSMLASLIFNQLLGGDLTDIKTGIFLPLISLLSENQQQKEFRIIFLDRLHKKCPYTVPYYPERQPTMNDKQYLEALGYIEKKEGDQIRFETETEFLNRMSGLIRLFCKLIVRRGPPFDVQLSYAWAWMADVLNLPPRPNITAMILRIFLDEAGEIMMKQYSGQFRKIIQAIESQYIPQFGKATSDDQIARLRLSIDAPLKKFS